jgi:hypothetical protein
MSYHFGEEKGGQLYEHATRGLLIYYLSTKAIFFLSKCDVSQFSVRYEYVLFGAPGQGQTLDVYQRSDDSSNRDVAYATSSG